MKKICYLISSVLLLAACSSSGKTENNITINDSSSVLVTIKDHEVTNQDFFDILIEQLGAATTLEFAIDYIYNQEIEDKEAVEAKAKESFDEYDTGEFAMYKEEILNIYNTMENFYNTYILAEAKRVALQELYVQDNFERLAFEGNFRKARAIAVEDEEEAYAILDALLNGANYEEIFREHDTAHTESNADNLGNLGLIHNEHVSLPTAEMRDEILNSSSVGIIDYVFASSDTYYIVDIIETDMQAMRTEVTDFLTTSNSVVGKTLVFFLPKYNFRVHEQVIFDIINDSNPAYFTGSEE